LRTDVRLEDPQIKRNVRRGGNTPFSDVAQDSGANARTMKRLLNVQVIEQRPPSGIIVRIGTAKPRNLIVCLRNDDMLPLIRRVEAPGPHGQAIGNDISSKIFIGHGTPIGRAPAGCMQRCD
jgi:hypothetical protein